MLEFLATVQKKGKVCGWYNTYDWVDDVTMKVIGSVANGLVVFPVPMAYVFAGVSSIIAIGTDGVVRGYIPPCKKLMEAVIPNLVSSTVTGTNITIAIDVCGNVWRTIETEENSWEKEEKIKNAKKVVICDEVMYVLDDFGDVWRWSDEVEVVLRSVRDISCITNHCLALSDEGVVWGIGSGYEGKLGINTWGIVTEWKQLLRDKVIKIAATMGIADGGRLGNGHDKTVSFL